MLYICSGIKWWWYRYGRISHRPRPLKTGHSHLSSDVTDCTHAANNTDCSCWIRFLRWIKPRFHYADFPVRGSFGEVGMVEFGLYCVDRPTNATHCQCAGGDDDAFTPYRTVLYMCPLLSFAPVHGELWTLTWRRRPWSRYTRDTSWQRRRRNCVGRLGASDDRSPRRPPARLTAKSYWFSWVRTSAPANLLIFCRDCVVVTCNPVVTASCDPPWLICQPVERGGRAFHDRRPARPALLLPRYVSACVSLSVCRWLLIGAYVGVDVDVDVDATRMWHRRDAKLCHETLRVFSLT